MTGLQTGLSAAMACPARAERTLPQELHVQRIIQWIAWVRTVSLIYFCASCA